MKFTAFSLVLFLAITSCSKTNLQRDVESFSSSSFITFEGYINGQDLLLTTDESFVVAGNAIEDGGAILRPCTLHTNDLPHPFYSYNRSKD